MAGAYATGVEINTMNPTDAVRLDADAFADALRRAKAEYLEMPGLKLTRHQAARLWASDVSLCDAVLSALVRDRFLTVTSSASFVRSE
jgi:hypothetical protein